MLSFLKFFAVILQPPGINLLLLLLGLYYWLRSNKFMSSVFLIGGFLFLYLISIPIVSDQLLDRLAVGVPPIQNVEDPHYQDVHAIVVLAAVDPVDDLELHRFTASLAKSTKLPILVSGNNYLMQSNYYGNQVESMARSLANDFGINGAIWVENEGYSIRQSAKTVKKILDRNSIKKVFLITNAWRMKNAAKSFQSAKIEVIPAPVFNRTIDLSSNMKNFTPRADCLLRSGLFFFAHLENIWSIIFEIFTANK